jgi:hypothetical protein
MVPTVEWGDEGADLVLTMEGHLLGGECGSAIEKFHGLVAGAGAEGSFRLVVKLHALTGYEPEARRLWTEALRPYRSRVSVLRLEGVTNPIIRMAGRTVGLVLGIPTEITE